MKVKVNELNGTALDWVTARALGIPAVELLIHGSGKYQSLFRKNRDEYGALNGRYTTGPDLLFSRKWEAGGPIIEREKISPGWSIEGHWGAYRFDPEDELEATFMHFGPTPLIAAMRCYVASKLGEEVDIPEELT